TKHTKVIVADEVSTIRVSRWDQDSTIVEPLTHSLTQMMLTLFYSSFVVTDLVNGFTVIFMTLTVGRVNPEPDEVPEVPPPVDDPPLVPPPDAPPPAAAPAGSGK